MSALDLLVIGDCNPDLVLFGEGVEPTFGQVERTIDQARLEIGGSATLTACAAARLGLRTALVSVVGDDVFGRFMRDSLDERGVQTTWCTFDAEMPTGLTVVLTRPDGDRAMLTAPGTLATIGAEHVPADALRAARHVHAGGFFLLPRLQPALAEIFRAARRAGASTSLDTGWDPTEGWSGE
ncbi:MAG: PfkB family carbohydrate kinase, partial [Actinomycetota bacterium]|nr:PfkB family carbohydrate kinase [Actinomycetota bacterium]